MTRAKETQPTRREVATKYDGPMVAEVTARVLTLRPKGCRRGGPAEVTVAWGAIYNRALMEVALEKARAKRAAQRARKRGGR